MEQIKKIFFAIIVILATAISIDAVIGFSMNILISHRVGSKSQYCLNEKINAEIIFCGSSRASHHYDTKYITDSLKIRSFNTGLDGKGLTYNYAIINSILNNDSNNTIKVIILETLPGELSGALNSRISELYPYINNDNNILDIATKIDKNNYWLLKLNLYKHNSVLFGEIKNFFHTYDSHNNGFEPLEPRKMIGLSETFDKTNENIDSVAKYCFVNIIKKCHWKGVKLIVVMSPELYKRNYNEEIIEICKQYGIPFIDNRAFRLSIPTDEYYNDNWHMNKIGAREYTKYFMEQIKPIINE